VTGTGAALPPVVREVGVFILVGGAATACHYAVTLAANRFGGLDLNIATLIGYASSVGVSYFGNSLFTFRRPALHGPQFARFAAISLAGLAVNQAVVFVSAHMLGWPPWLALIPVVILVPASTFTLAKFWAFRPPAEAAE
jgi:putative flippase GtrA